MLRWRLVDSLPRRSYCCRSIDSRGDTVIFDRATFAIFVTAVAAGEAALAFALVFAMYRAVESVEITDASEMKN
ncbi:MAG: hypothetical protein Ct9H300mP19_04950 [Dehalococcoidia bacterium]|nr:MAG: hypothetical protein Ct9H300mP19_04950 [Dehalococcoidia bacterium]